MKNVKKLLAVLLALVMVLSLFAGCDSKSGKKKSSKKDDDDDDEEIVESGDSTGAPTGTISVGGNEVDLPTGSGNSDNEKPTTVQKETYPVADTTAPIAPTESEEVLTPSIGVPVGTELDAPEIIFDVDGLTDIYISYQATAGSLTENSKLYMKTISDDSGILYVVDNATILVYEVNGNSINRYVKSATQSNITPDNSLSDVELAAEMQTIYTLLAVFTDYTTIYQGATYRKTGATSTAYTYDMMLGGITTKVSIDQATGLLVGMESSTGTITVTEFKTTGVTIPSYK